MATPAGDRLHLLRAESRLRRRCCGTPSGHAPSLRASSAHVMAGSSPSTSRCVGAPAAWTSPGEETSLSTRSRGSGPSRATAAVPCPVCLFGPAYQRSPRGNAAVRCWRSCVSRACLRRDRPLRDSTGNPPAVCLSSLRPRQPGLYEATEFASPPLRQYSRCGVAGCAAGRAAASGGARAGRPRFVRPARIACIPRTTAPSGVRAIGETTLGPGRAVCSNDSVDRPSAAA